MHCDVPFFFVLFCCCCCCGCFFVFLLYSFFFQFCCQLIMDLCNIFNLFLRSWSTDTGVMVSLWFPQCQRSNPEGFGWNQSVACHYKKKNKVRTVCIILWMYYVALELRVVNQNIVACCYNSVQYNRELHTTRQWARQNIQHISVVFYTLFFTFCGLNNMSDILKDISAIYVSNIFFQRIFLQLYWNVTECCSLLSKNKPA